MEVAALTFTPLALIRHVFATERRLSRPHLLFGYRRERLTPPMGFHIRGTRWPHQAFSILLRGLNGEDACFFTLFFKGRNQQANKQSRGSGKIMLNFSQGARGNVGKVNQTDAHPHAYTSHMDGCREHQEREKKEMEMVKHVDLDRLLNERIVVRKLQGRTRTSTKKRKIF